MHWILALGIHGGLLTQLGTFESYKQCTAAASVVIRLVDRSKNPEIGCIKSDDPEAASIAKPQA